MVPVDLGAGESSEVKLEMHRHGESASDLANAIAKNGSATVYGLEFDFDKAMLKPGSETALNAILSLIKGQPGSRWNIAGHTDNQGGADYNLKLSQTRGIGGGLADGTWNYG